MKTQKIERWGTSGSTKGTTYELSEYITQLMNEGKTIVSVIPTRYYGSNQSDIEIALIITEENDNTPESDTICDDIESLKEVINKYPYDTNATDHNTIVKQSEEYGAFKALLWLTEKNAFMDIGFITYEDWKKNK